MFRLLQITTVPVTLEAFLLPFAAHFRSDGWTVDALSSDLSASLPCTRAFDHCYSLPFQRQPFKNPIFSLSTSIRSLVSKNRYDIVHVHTPVAAFLSRFALRNLRCQTRIVYTAHGFHFGYGSASPLRNPYFYLEKIAGRWTDALLVINADDYRTAHLHRLVQPESLYHVPGIGVDLRKYSRQNVLPIDRTNVRRELNLQPSDFALLMIAEFNPGKRHRDLLHALCRTANSKFHAVFAGDGPLLSKTKTLARSLGLEKQTRFLGVRKDVVRLMAAADAAILPSEREGLPRSIMECMAFGIPVLGSDIRGTSELLSDNCGLLFPVSDISAIAAAISRIQADSNLAKTCLENASAKIKHYSLDYVLAVHDRIYRHLLRQSRSPVGDH